MQPGLLVEILPLEPQLLLDFGHLFRNHIAPGPVRHLPRDSALLVRGLQGGAEVVGVDVVQLAVVNFDQGDEGAGFVQVAGPVGAALLAVQLVAIPREGGAAEGIGLVDSSAQGVVAVAEALRDSPGGFAVDASGDLGPLQLMRRIPDQYGDGLCC